MEVLKRYRLFKKLDPDFRINKLDYFEEMKEFKPLIAYSNFLWKGENNDK